MTSGPLAGVDVVEFGNLIAAPYASMVLADLGASVTKVEPLNGDLGRGFGPYVNGESVFFVAVNRGKRSLAVNPKNPRIAPALARLVESADVVINNLRHGSMERMGFAEEDVRAINPGAVYAVVSAFGADGPYAQRAGIDVIFQGESGMISVSGSPGDPPAKTATTIGDYVAATNAALAISAALVEKERTGVGRRVDVALRDGLIAVQSGWFALHLASGEQPEKTGTASPFLAPNRVFPTSDGLLALAIVSDRHFAILADELGRPDLAQRYRTNASRLEAGDVLASELEDLFRVADTETWVRRLENRGLPVGRILEFADVLSDPQVVHNEMVVEEDHPAMGRIRQLGSPLRISGAPARAATPAPTLGQHTREILIELGLSDTEIGELLAEGEVAVS